MLKLVAFVSRALAGMRCGTVLCKRAEGHFLVVQGKRPSFLFCGGTCRLGVVHWSRQGSPVLSGSPL